MIDEEGRNCTVVADGRSDAAVPLCSERASDAHLTRPWHQSGRSCSSCDVGGQLRLVDNKWRQERIGK